MTDKLTIPELSEAIKSLKAKGCHANARRLIGDYINEAVDFFDANTWQPIESAPRDGTAVFALCLEDYPQAVEWMREMDYGEGEVVQVFKSLVTGRYVSVTHWQPLPNPPKEKDND